MGELTGEEGEVFVALGDLVWPRHLSNIDVASLEVNYGNYISASPLRFTGSLALLLPFTIRLLVVCSLAYRIAHLVAYLENFSFCKA